MANVPSPKYVLELAREIEDTKSRLAALEEKWNNLFTGNGEISEPVAINRGGRKADPDGPASRVLATVESVPLTEWNSESVVHATGLAKKQVDKALYNLCEAKKIQRVDRGLYAPNAYIRPRPLTNPTFDLQPVN